jgi:ABC-2 type transport system permease protein
VPKPLPILRRSLTDSWRSLLGWTAGLLAALALYLPLFPSIAANGQMQVMLEGMPPELISTLGFGQITTGAGYAQSTFFGLIGFLLLVIACTSWGAAAIAGAEESGALELALAHGVGRVQYALESALSIVLRLLWLCGVSALVVIALNEPSELQLEPAKVVAVTAALLGLALLSAAAALAVGAITGRRSIGVGAGAGIAVLGYVLNAIANQAADLEGLGALSPYSWAFHETPLSSGADGGGLALLWGLSAVLIAAAALALRRRDIVG